MSIQIERRYEPDRLRMLRAIMLLLQKVPATGSPRSAAEYPSLSPIPETQPSLVSKTDIGEDQGGVM